MIEKYGKDLIIFNFDLIVQFWKFFLKNMLWKNFIQYFQFTHTRWLVFSRIHTHIHVYAYIYYIAFAYIHI